MRCPFQPQYFTVGSEQLCAHSFKGQFGPKLKICRFSSHRVLFIHLGCFTVTCACSRTGGKHYLLPPRAKRCHVPATQSHPSRFKRLDQMTELRNFTFQTLLRQQRNLLRPHLMNDYILNPTTRGALSAS